MIPEYILEEEKEHHYYRIILIALISTFLGFFIAQKLFPSQVDILAPVFAAIPIVYPLTAKLLDDEKENRNYVPEIKSYGAIFTGQVLAFFSIALVLTEKFSLQREIIGITGYATQSSATFTSILINNLTVFAAIFILSIITASAGAFILTWNASVMGIFFAHLVTQLPNDISLLLGTSETPSPIAYLPHSTFEMTGFIIAGISGTLISAALYRKHFEKENALKFIKLAAVGLLMVIIGVVLETL